MVCKEELCTWFKSLSPHCRIDFMCGLLHVCLPPELRFIGTVVEDLGRTNFQFLREAELAANSLSEVNRITELGGHVQRSKIATSLALLHSSNTACANVLFSVIESANLSFNVCTSITIQTVYEILMILTMAVNHPAFSFDQKNKLFDLFERCEVQALKLSKFQGKNEKDLLHIHHDNQSTSVDECNLKSNSCSSGSPNCKVFVQDIDVQSFKKKDNRVELKFQVSWSNGEINEVYKTYQELQEFHYMLLKQAHETEQNSQSDAQFPSYPDMPHYNEDDILEEFRNYTRILLRCVFPLLERKDHVTEFFQNNNRVLEISDKIKQQSPLLSPSMTSRAEIRPKSTNSSLSSILSTINRYQCPPCLRMPPPFFTGHSPLSSPNNSPHNSRSASPSTQNCDMTSVRHPMNQQKASMDNCLHTEKKDQCMNTDEVNLPGNLKDVPYKKTHLTRERSNHISSTGLDLMNSKRNGSQVFPSWPPLPIFPPYLHVAQSGAYRCETVFPQCFQHYPPVKSQSNIDGGPEHASLPLSPLPSGNKFQKNSDSSSDDNEREKRDPVPVKVPSEDMFKRVVNTKSGGHMVHHDKVVDYSNPQYSDLKPNIQLLPSPVVHREHMLDPNSCLDIKPLVSGGCQPRPIMQIKAQPAHTNILHASVINMPPETYAGMTTVPSINKMQSDISSSSASVQSSLHTSVTYNVVTNNSGTRPTELPVHSVTEPTETNGSKLLNTGCNMNTSNSETYPSPQTHSNQPAVNNNFVKIASHSSDFAESNQMSSSVQPTATKVELSKQSTETPRNSPCTTTATFTSEKSTSCNHTSCSSCSCNGQEMPRSTMLNPFDGPYCYVPVRFPVSNSNGVNPQVSFNLPYAHHLNLQLPNGINPDALYGNHPNFGLHQSNQHCMHLNMLHGLPPYEFLNNRDAVKHKRYSCFNCGSNSHKAAECKENSMASLSAHYHLNYKPKSKSDSE